jgi:hypothetical protein
MQARFVHRNQHNVGAGGPRSSHDKPTIQGRILQPKQYLWTDECEQQHDGRYACRHAGADSLNKPCFT